MKNNKFINELLSFIEESTSCFTCVQKIKKELLENGFIELYEQDKWTSIPNKFFVTRNEGSIIAIEIPKEKTNAFKIITTHCDTPSLLLKPNGAYTKEGYLKYNIMPYGGILNYGWLDHPLSLSGRVLIKEKNQLKSKIIDTKEPLLIVPSVAIHQNDKANTNLDLNMQTDLQPILSLSDIESDFKELIYPYTKGNVIDFDLYAYNGAKPLLIGKNKEILVSPRIDNLTSVYSALQSFTNSTSDKIKILCSFNHEEIGSLTEEGADSNFLLDILKRIAATLNIDIASSLSSSMIISSDNTHAVHPNHEEYADNTGKAYLGKGFTIIRESTTTTNGLSSSIIKTICKKNRLKYQDATSKNDLTGGSTLSGISLRHVSILSADIGIAQLSMHSSIETCSIKDVLELYKLMKAFYQTKFDLKKENIILYD